MKIKTLVTNPKFRISGYLLLMTFLILGDVLAEIIADNNDIDINYKNSGGIIMHSGQYPGHFITLGSSNGLSYERTVTYITFNTTAGVYYEKNVTWNFAPTHPQEYLFQFRAEYDAISYNLSDISAHLQYGIQYKHIAPIQIQYNETSDIFHGQVDLRDYITLGYSRIHLGINTTRLAGDVGYTRRYNIDIRETKLLPVAFSLTIFVAITCEVLYYVITRKNLNRQRNEQREATLTRIDKRFQQIEADHNHLLSQISQDSPNELPDRIE